VIDDRYNDLAGKSRPTTRMKNIDPIHCIVRMNVRPFYPFRKHRIIPLHSQKCGDPLLLPLSSVSLSSSSFRDRQQQQINNEWRSIWLRLHIFMTQDTVLTDDHTLVKLTLLLYTILMTYTIILPMIPDPSMIYAGWIIGFCSIALVMLFVFFTYVRYGDPNHRLGIIREVPPLSSLRSFSP
jgi:hypothetical protein